MDFIKLLFSRRWWWVTLIVIIGMAVLFRLGIWQLDRLAQRRAANVVLLEQLTSEPLSLNDPELDVEALDEMPDRAAVARGEFDYSEQLWLKLQNLQGQAGGHLLAPLRIAGRDDAVLVDRGWVPAENEDPTTWAQFDVAGLVTVEGYLQLAETSRRADPPSEPQQEWYRVDVEAIERQMPYDLLPVYLLQAPVEGNGSLPYRQEPEFDLSEGPHLSYAIQWFLFTLILGGGYLFFVRRQSEKGER